MGRPDGITIGGVHTQSEAPEHRNAAVATARVCEAVALDGA
jgi:hypothetical protein